MKRQGKDKNHKAAQNARHYNVIKQFESAKDVPAWYRGGSVFQKKASDKLFHAIRDDAEQNTTHRIRACLEGVGIYPIVSDKNLKQLINMSRLSDLAYLWFLWELHYKTNNKYDLNEQLILTAIAHLDMVTTMRELDRILPPGHPPKKVLNMNLAKKEREKEQREKRKHQQTKLKKKYASPYFEPLERPQPYGKTLIPVEPDFRVNLQGYEAYKNPNYVVVNESNRWFTNYSPCPGARAANELLDDVLEKIREELNSQFTAKIINSLINKDDKEEKSVCTFHREMEETKELTRTEKFVTMRDKCLKSLEVHGYKKTLQVKRIIDNLEKDVESYRKIIRDKVKPPEKQNQVNVLGKECFCEYMIQGPGDDEEECRQPDLYLWVSEKGEVERLSSSSKVNPSNVPQSEIMRLTGGAEAEGIEIKKGNTVEVPKNVISGTVDPRKSNVSIASNTRFHETCPTSNVDTPESAEQFFIPPEEHKPYEFDYRKIFNFVFLNDEEKLKHKRLYLDALDCNEKEVKKLLDSTPDIMDAVNSYALKTWKELMVIQREKELEEEKKKKDATYIPILPNIPVQEIYDCDDNELMYSMLKEALNYMSKNPKFVLATMKDAHKLPVLREWICYRYGKTYTKAQRLESYKFSFKIFRALQKNPPTVTIPQLKQMGTNTQLDYSCQHYVTKKATFIKRRTREQLAKAVMDQTRIFWFAMRPYLCCNGPPRSTYFAYAPARIHEIFDFRPWKPDEYMDAKSEWDARQRAKARKGKN